MRGHGCLGDKKEGRRVTMYGHVYRRRKDGPSCGAALLDARLHRPKWGGHGAGVLKIGQKKEGKKPLRMRGQFVNPISNEMTRPGSTMQSLRAPGRGETGPAKGAQEDRWPALKLRCSWEWGADKRKENVWT